VLRGILFLLFARYAELRVLPDLYGGGVYEKSAHTKGPSLLRRHLVLTERNEQVKGRRALESGTRKLCAQNSAVCNRLDLASARKWLLDDDARIHCSGTGLSFLTGNEDDLLWRMLQ